MEPSRHKQLRYLIAILCIIALAMSFYLLLKHLTPGGTVCDINEKINCDIVNKSTYAEILGIPVSALGMAHYLFGLLIILLPHIWERWFDRDLLYQLFSLELFIGTGFSIYLTYVQGFLIGAWCPFCVLSAVITITNMVLVTWLWRRTMQKY